MPKVTGLDHLVLTVADIDVTVAFYEDLLGMRAEIFYPADGSTRVALAFGAQKINLHEVGREFEPKAAKATAGSADLCFLTETSLDEWRVAFDAAGVAIEEGPVRRTGAAGPILSLYVRDPDGNLIEVSVPAD
ncbi:VOC family protein [Aestuariibius sp. 2305UL40-4]|uniref:VOC family protein n=1 Tax=Aestuariibius violaceus TaxID=3234132 RepID=UPI00345E3FAC